MAEKIKLVKSKVRHVGTFDFKETYRVLFEWLIQERYAVDETSYKEVVGPAGKEVDIFWEATKVVSDYFKFSIGIRFHPLAMTSVEVEIDGVKQKMNKGDFTIETECALIHDQANKWADNNFTKSLRNMYEKFLIKERVEKYEGALIGEFNAMEEFIKSFLVLTGKK
jgi:hypothetical protein